MKQRMVRPKYPLIGHTIVRPTRFGSNAETAGSNFFQHASRRADDAANALREFDALALHPEQVV